jgi:tetratricopeptide (TPR) repeat protein
MQLHPPGEILFLLKRGWLSSEEATEVEAHLEDCERCQILSRSVSERRDKLIPLEAYEKIVDVVSSSVLEESGEIEDQRSSVPMLWDELSRLRFSQQKLVVENSPRCQVWGLAEHLLLKSRECWTDDPLRSEELAELAFVVAERLSFTGLRERLGNDLKAEAWSYVGNSRRIRSDLYGAGLAFREAEKYLTLGSGDPMEAARLLDLESSFERACRNFDSACRLLRGAIELYRKAGERQLEGRALINEANLLRACGKPDASIQVLQRAENLLNPEDDPLLWFLLKKNLLLFLTEAGRTPEAQELLPEVRELGRVHASRLERLRLLWTEGLLRKSLGQAELAAEILNQVRDGFVAQGIGYDVALVSLDLAGLYLENGRSNEARRLATESIPLFTSRGVHREALMAWNLFREAAERDALTLGLVQEVASRIRQSQSRPTAGGDLA